MSKIPSSPVELCDKLLNFICDNGFLRNGNKNNTTWTSSTRSGTMTQQEVINSFLSKLESLPREYRDEIPKYASVMSVEDWNNAVEDGSFIDDDGIGYWVKDGKESKDEVFSTPQEDATHVAWYNK